MTTYKHSFVSVTDTDHEAFAKKIETWIGHGYYIAGSTIGVKYSVEKWFPPKIKATYWAFLQKTQKIEDKDYDGSEDNGD